MAKDPTVNLRCEGVLFSKPDRIASHIARIVTGGKYQVVGLLTKGESAIQAVEQALPDAILMDVQLGGELMGMWLVTMLIHHLGQSKNEDRTSPHPPQREDGGHDTLREKRTSSAFP